MKKHEKPKKDVRQTDGVMKSLMDIADGFASRWWEHHSEALKQFAEEDDAAESAGGE